MSEGPSKAQLVVRDCPICGAAESREYVRKGELRLVACSACSMIYTSPVRAELASGAYYDREAAAYYLSPAKLESDYADVRFERELRLFRKHCQSGRVLDVGCSSGAFLHQLAKRYPNGYELLGTDASGPALDHAEKMGIPAVRGDFLAHDFAGKKFQAVTLWAVLEHLACPGAFVQKAGSILAPNGLCFVLVPNLRSLAARLLGARYRYVYEQHLNYFTRTTLEKLVRNDFEVLECRSTHFNPVVIWQDWRQAGAEVTNEARAALLQKTTAFKQNPVLKPAKAAYKLLEAVLGRLGLADNLAIVLRKTEKS